MRKVITTTGVLFLLPADARVILFLITSFARSQLTAFHSRLALMFNRSNPQQFVAFVNINGEVEKPGVMPLMKSNYKKK